MGQHALEVVVVDYLRAGHVPRLHIEFDAKMEMTKTRHIQDDDGQVDV